MPVLSTAEGSFHSGFISILGKANVGKSTLLNALIGQKIAAVSKCPQTTRNRILGICHLTNAQMIFLDSPGYHHSKRPLNQWMQRQIKTNLEDADIILFMSAIDAPWDHLDRELYQAAALTEKPLMPILNKIDAVPKEKLLPRLQEMSTDCHDIPVFPVSAHTGDGLPELLDRLKSLLPEGPSFYPEDIPTDQSIRTICAEIIRAEAMAAMREEIPYGLAVLVEEFKESGEAHQTTRIQASIIVEKKSQKPILIGKQGSQLKKIGTEARKEIETLISGKVFLSLFVKVSKDWTKDPRKRKEFGYG